MRHTQVFAGILLVTATSVFASPRGAAAAFAIREPPAHRGGPASSGASPFPFQNGDAWITTVTGTETITVPGSQSTTQPYDYTQADVEICPQTFNGFANLCADQETYSNQLDAVTTTYYGYVSQGALTDLDLYGGAFSFNANGYAESGSYTDAPAAVYYQFGGSKGSRFGAETTIDEAWQFSQPGGISGTVDWLIRADGTYNFVQRYAMRRPRTKTTQIIRDLAGGAGEIETVQAGKGSSTTTVTFGVPTVVSGAWVIPVTTTTPSGASTVDVPDWFPGNGPAPKKLQREEVRDEGLVKMPAVCGPYSGTDAEDFRATFYELDPSRGTYATDTEDDYFIDGTGAVCVPEMTDEKYFDNTTTGALAEDDLITDVQILTSDNYGQALLRVLATGPAHASAARSAAGSAMHGRLRPFLHGRRLGALPAL